MPQPAANQPSPSPSSATCPRCGHRLPVNGNVVASCPLCREKKSPGDRSTEKSLSVLTASDFRTMPIGMRRESIRWLLVGGIVGLAVIAVAVYYLA